MLETLIDLDQRITLALNSLHCEAGDWFWQFFSLKETWFPLYAAVLFIVIRRLGCYDSYMMRHGLHVLEKRAGYYGFFSGHAANAFGFAAASSISLEMDKNHRYGAYQWFIFFWATLIGLSRIFAGKHYFGDVVVGAIVGFALGCAIAGLFRLPVTRREPLSPSGFRVSP